MSDAMPGEYSFKDGLAALYVVTISFQLYDKGSSQLTESDMIKNTNLAAAVPGSIAFSGRSAPKISNAARDTIHRTRLTRFIISHEIGVACLKIKRLAQALCVISGTFSVHLNISQEN